LPGTEAGAWPEITLPEITLRVSFCKAVVRKVEPWPNLARGISS
jgi:hypothetical protein